METSLIYLVLAIVLPISGMAGYIAKKYLEPSSYAGKTKRLMDDYIKELEVDNKSLQKQINAMKRGAKISEEDMSDPENAIMKLIPQFEHLVPKSMKPLLRDPQLVKTAMTLYKENPEAAKKLLGQFVSKKGVNKELIADESKETVSV